MSIPTTFNLPTISSAMLLLIVSGCASPLMNEDFGLNMLPRLSRRTEGQLSDAQKIDIQIGLGRTMERQGDLERAEALYRQILDQQSNHSQALHRLAIVCDRQMRFEESRELFRSALREDPENHVLLGDFGYSLYRQQKWDEAEKAMRKVLQLAPRDRRAHNHLGLLLAQTDRRDEALLEFRRAGCDTSQAHSNLLTVLELNGRTMEAKSETAIAARARRRIPESFAVEPDTGEVRQVAASGVATIGL